MCGTPHLSRTISTGSRRPGSATSPSSLDNDWRAIALRSLAAPCCAKSVVSRSIADIVATAARSATRPARRQCLASRHRRTVINLSFGRSKTFTKASRVGLSYHTNALTPFQHSDDLRLLEEFRPPDCVAVVFAVADLGIGPRIEQQPHDVSATMSSGEVESRDVGVPVGP